MVNRWIAFALAVVAMTMLTGCGQKETEKPTTEMSHAVTEVSFDPAQIDAILQGKWEYCDAVLGTHEAISFQNGSVLYTTWLDAAPDKVTVSAATYTVEADGVNLYFPATDHHNKFSYSWVGTELILHKYIDSGTDKGNTRIYQKQDTTAADSETETVSPAPTEPSDVAVGEWIAGGLVSKGSVYDFSSNSALADLYDTNWVYINDDGSFQLQNGIYTYQGTWIEATVENAEHFYVFNQTEVTRFAMEDGELKEVTSDNAKTYYGAFLDNSFNVLLVYETLDDDESPLIYLRDGKQSHLSAMMNDENADSLQEINKPSSDKNTANESIQSQSITSGQRNALAVAQNYLDFMPFSYTGLIEQLEFEGYTRAEATYAADNCGADWYEQAVRAAENYLEIMAFSRSGLLEQLEFEGYTYDQAVYGVDKAY